jgi:hypothetical protein
MTDPKAAAVAVLGELPSVLGATLELAPNGAPAEVHLLIDAGPAPAALARDVRDLLEEHLRQRVDQRVISIAQLAAPGQAKAALGGHGPAEDDRLVLGGYEARSELGRVGVSVRLERNGEAYEGAAEELDVGPRARARAGAGAALRALSRAGADGLTLTIDTVSIVPALGREYVLVSAFALAPWLGRRPLLLSGAHDADDGVEAAGVLAALKAANRISAGP